MTNSTNKTQEYLTPSFETFMQACLLDGGLRERANPGAALEDSRRELIGPRRQQTRELFRELLGPAASNEAVLFCETSIINQWLAVNFFKQRRGFLLGRERLSKQAVEHHGATHHPVLTGWFTRGARSHAGSPQQCNILG